MKNKTQQLKVMYIARQMIVDLLCSMTLRKCVPWTEDLPGDIAVVNIHYDSAHDQFAVVLASETFPEVELGARLEEIKPMYTWIKCIVEGEGSPDDA